MPTSKEDTNTTDKVNKAFTDVSTAANNAAKAVQNFTAADKALVAAVRTITQGLAEENKITGQAKIALDQEIKTKRILISHTDLLNVAMTKGVGEIIKGTQERLKALGAEVSYVEASKAVNDALLESTSFMNIMSLSGKNTKDVLSVISQGFTELNISGNLNVDGLMKQSAAMKLLEERTKDNGKEFRNLISSMLVRHKIVKDENEALDMSNKVYDIHIEGLQKVISGTENYTSVLENIGKSFKKWVNDLKIGERGAWAAFGGIGYAIEKLIISSREAAVKMSLPLGGGREIYETGGGVRGGTLIDIATTNLKRMGFNASEAGQMLEENARQGLLAGKGFADLPGLLDRTVLKGVGQKFYGMSEQVSNTFVDLMQVSLGRTTQDTIDTLEKFRNKINSTGVSSELYGSILNTLINSTLAFDTTTAGLTILTEQFAGDIQKGRTAAGDLAKTLVYLRNASFGTQIGLVNLAQRMGGFVPQALRGASPLATISRMTTQGSVTEVDLLKMTVDATRNLAMKSGRTEEEQRAMFMIIGEGTTLQGATRTILERLWELSKKGIIGESEGNQIIKDMKTTSIEHLSSLVDKSAKISESLMTLSQLMERSISISGTGFKNITGLLTAARAIELLGLINTLFPGGGAVEMGMKATTAVAGAAMGPEFLSIFMKSLSEEGSLLGTFHAITGIKKSSEREKQLREDAEKRVSASEISTGMPYEKDIFIHEEKVKQKMRELSQTKDVTREAEIKQLAIHNIDLFSKRILQNLDTTFGGTLEVPVVVKVDNLKVSLSDKDKKEIRIMVQEGVDKYLKDQGLLKGSL